MTRDLTYHISGADTGIKIEEYLKQLGCSHHVLTHLKRTEHGIVLNGAWAYASQRLSEGDLLQLHITEEACSEQIVPVRLPLRIVYEDADLMVIDKPADMPIHPSVNNHDNTLANAVMYYFSEQNLPFVYRCVNRLDRDTSGLLILAKICSVPPSSIRCLPAEKSTGIIWQSSRARRLPLALLCADRPQSRFRHHALRRCHARRSGHHPL